MEIVLYSTLIDFDVPGVILRNYTGRPATIPATTRTTQLAVSSRWNEYFEQTAIEATTVSGYRYLELSACYVAHAHRGRTEPVKSQIPNSKSQSKHTEFEIWILGFGISQNPHFTPNCTIRGEPPIDVIRPNAPELKVSANIEEVSRTFVRK